MAARPTHAFGIVARSSLVIRSGCPAEQKMSAIRCAVRMTKGIGRRDRKTTPGSAGIRQSQRGARSGHGCRPPAILRMAARSCAVGVGAIVDPSLPILR